MNDGFDQPEAPALKLRSFGHCNPKRKRGTKLEECREVPRLPAC